MRILPSSIGMEPQMMLSSDVLPEPLEPTTQTNCRSGMEREKSLNRQVSLTVPPWYTLTILRSSSMTFRLLSMTARDDDDEQQRRRDEFEIKRGEAEAQCERHTALIEDGTEHDGGCRAQKAQAAKQLRAATARTSVPVPIEISKYR